MYLMYRLGRVPVARVALRALRVEGLLPALVTLWAYGLSI